jgi:hypothetical protein
MKQPLSYYTKMWQKAIKKTGLKPKDKCDPAYKKVKAVYTELLKKDKKKREKKEKKVWKQGIAELGNISYSAGASYKKKSSSAKKSPSPQKPKAKKRSPGLGIKMSNWARTIA